MRLPEKVNVLILGSGGREHAFAWKVSQSEQIAKLYVAPGNAGTANVAINVDLQPSNFGSVKQFVINNNINLVIVGPEEPLVRGIYDFFHEDDQLYHVPVVGPSALGAKLEGSKEFAKAFMMRNEIPTAAYGSFTKETVAQGYVFLENLQPPYVLKADGLAAGKGVVILDNLDEAKVELDRMLGGKFGAAGNTVVIEQFLKGIECSVFVATDGKSFKILPEAKDYKRIGEGDTGLNTGGMGAVSPVPFADEVFMEKVRKRIVEPTIAGFAKEKIDYKGFVFIGLMNDGGEPYVIEYNVRMGDPETEVVFARIESDIMGLFRGIACGTLDKYELQITPQVATTVVCVAGGYPGEYKKGDCITGLDTLAESVIFHAGTAVASGEVVTNGGRVLAVTSLGDTITEALAKSYQTIEGIEYSGKYCRKDIGQDLL